MHLFLKKKRESYKTTYIVIEMIEMHGYRKVHVKMMTDKQKL